MCCVECNTSDLQFSARGLCVYVCVCFYVYVYLSGMFIIAIGEYQDARMQSYRKKTPNRHLGLYYSR